MHSGNYMCPTCNASYAKGDQLRDHLKRELMRQILVAAGQVRKADPESSSSSESDDPDIRFVGPGGRKSKKTGASLKRRTTGDGAVSLGHGLKQRPVAAKEDADDGDADEAAPTAPPPAKRIVDAAVRDVAAVHTSTAGAAKVEKTGKTASSASAAASAGAKIIAAPSVPAAAPSAGLSLPFPRKGTIVAITPYPSFGCRTLVLISSQRLRSARDCPYEPWETKWKAFYRHLRNNYQANHARIHRKYELAFSWSFRPDHRPSWITRAEEADLTLTLRELVARKSGLGVGLPVITADVLRDYRAQPAVARELAAADAVSSASAAAADVDAPSAVAAHGKPVTAGASMKAVPHPHPFPDKAVILFDWLWAKGEEILDNASADTAAAGVSSVDAEGREPVPQLRLYYRLIERPTPLEMSPAPGGAAAAAAAKSAKSASPSKIGKPSSPGPGPR